MRRHHTTRERLRKELTLARWLLILATLCAVGALSYWVENIRERFPELVTLQLKTFDWLTHYAMSSPDQQRTVGVEIDEATFFDCLGEKSGQGVTDRAFLAALVQRAVDERAQVIALDINLTADPADLTDVKRMEGNRLLFDAFAAAAAQEPPIPVVLTQGFNDPTSMRPLPNIQDGKNTSAEEPAQKRLQESAGKCWAHPADLKIPAAHERVVIPDCGTDEAGSGSARASFDLQPDDKRFVPLTVYTSEGVLCPSFALQVASAWERTEAPDNTGASKIDSLLTAKRKGGQRFALAGFIPEDASVFPHVSAKDVYGDRNGNAQRNNLSGKIVLIGGRRPYEKGGKDWVDFHTTPAGSMAGMYVQANYIQALLDDRVLLPLNWWWQGLMSDIVLALFVISLELLWEERRSHRALMLIPATLLLLLTCSVVYYARFTRWTSLMILAVVIVAILVPIFWQPRAREMRPARKRMNLLLLGLIAAILICIAIMRFHYYLDLLPVVLVLFVHHIADGYLSRKEQNRKAAHA